MKCLGFRILPSAVECNRNGYEMSNYFMWRDSNGFGLRFYSACFLAQGAHTLKYVDVSGYELPLVSLNFVSSSEFISRPMRVQ